VNNKAGAYADDYGQFSTAIKLFFNNTINDLVPDQINLLEVVNQQEVVIASGQMQHFEIQLLDYQGQIVKSDNTTFAKIVFMQENQVDQIDISSNIALCEGGICNFDEIKFIVPPKKTVAMSVKVTVDELNEIEKEFDLYPTTFSLYSRTCEAGEKLT
jgi:hypothetical protein